MERDIEEYLQEQAKKLNKEQKEQIKQVAATMALSNMPLTKVDYQNLIDAVTGVKTVEQVTAEIVTKYKKEQ